MERLLEEGLYRNYPECKGQVETCDLGTPLTCEHYLRSNEGSIYGIASTSQRLESRFDRLLVPSTPIKGLFMSG
jgi:phytoene dehydrogenase-like protein